MTASFGSSFAEELAGFLRFKRSLGYSYLRAEYTLREFDRFLQEHAAQDHWRMDQAMLAWLASTSGITSKPANEDHLKTGQRA